jgi:DNA modification methylase
MNDINATMYGTDLFGESMAPAASGPVAERFGFPPFSVLDAKQGEWQERKRAWAALGIRGEVGRDAVSYTCNSDTQGDKYDYMPKIESGTSIFDPVLCECMYRWFSPVGGQIVDPFAGGSVRGIVAGMLGRRYWGCDLRQEQIDANAQQATDINPPVRPVWVCGDSMDTLEHAPDADLVFSCPPYGDLEKYSEDPKDLSAMEWHTFRAAYGRIILRSVQRLKQDRFACFVVGDFRDPRGFYRDFVSTTIAAFRDAGAELYNEAVLLTSVGSACMRVTKQFNAGRKFAKTHQNVLVFCKGDWRKAAKACGEVTQ